MLSFLFESYTPLKSGLMNTKRKSRRHIAEAGLGAGPTLDRNEPISKERTRRTSFEMKRGKVPSSAGFLMAPFSVSAHLKRSSVFSRIIFTVMRMD